MNTCTYKVKSSWLQLGGTFYSGKTRQIEFLLSVHHNIENMFHFNDVSFQAYFNLTYQLPL